MTDKEYRNCPYCDEEIKIKAIKCKHCQSMLNEKSTRPEVETEEKPFIERAVADRGNKTANAGETLTKTGTSLMTIGCFLTLFVTIPILLILFFVGC